MPRSSKPGAKAAQEGGVVERVLPGGLYQIRLEDGRKVTASLGALARKTTVRVVGGDRVLVEISPLEPTRGRIVRKV